MKNVVNRALVAKKKQYFQPATQIAHIALESMVLAGSSAGGGGSDFSGTPIGGDPGDAI